MFACVTSALMIGSLADRGRILPAVVFIFVWSTLVYDPIACWVWNPNGWAAKLGSLDYAGGTPVHVASGFGALALSLMLGEKIETKDEAASYRPHAIIFVVIGTFFMWVGWFGFNTGTSLAPTTRAAQALINSQISAAFGGFTWAIMDFRLARKWSVVGFCSGIIAGLVSITPGAGYLPTWAAVISGVLGGACANFGTKLKFFLRIDDSLDVFAVHGLGALVGNVLTGIFASSTIAALDRTTEIPGGWIDHHYMQLGYQLASTVAAAAYSFVVTLIILFVINKIPGLHLRVTPEQEEQGLDFAEHDEYAFDYVELFPQLPLPHEMWGDNPHENNGEGCASTEGISENGEDYNGRRKASADLEAQNRTSKTHRMQSKVGLFKLLSALQKSNEHNEESSDPESAEKRRSSPASPPDQFVSMSINPNAHNGPMLRQQRAPLELRPDPPGSFNEFSMFPNRAVPPGTSNHHTPAYSTYSEEDIDPTTRQNLTQVSAVRPSSISNNHSHHDHLNNHQVHPLTEDPHITSNNASFFSRSRDDLNQPIEGSSTYRRIQDHLDLSRWRGRFRQVGIGLLSRNNSIVSEADGLSNLSPTATGHNPGHPLTPFNPAYEASRVTPARASGGVTHPSEVGSSTHGLDSTSLSPTSNIPAAPLTSRRSSEVKRPVGSVPLIAQSSHSSTTGME